MHATSPRLGFTVLITAMLGLSLLFSGCTSTRLHHPSAGANLLAEVRVGDQINCRMNDGTDKAFTITAVEPAALVGEAGRVPLADISFLEVTRFDGKKTILQTGKVVGAVVICTAALAGLGLMGLAMR